MYNIFSENIDINIQKRYNYFGMICLKRIYKGDLEYEEKQKQ